MDASSEPGEVTDAATVLEEYRAFLDEFWDPEIGLGDWSGLRGRSWVGCSDLATRVVWTWPLGASGTGAQ